MTCKEVTKPEEVVVNYGRKKWKVNRFRVFGTCDTRDSAITIDPALTSRSDIFLETCIHEALHALHPGWSEAKVSSEALFCAEVVKAAKEARRWEVADEKK